jgi:hypothetical protein
MTDAELGGQRARTPGRGTGRIADSWSVRSVRARQR